MISYKDILFSFTKLLKPIVNADVIVEDSKGIFSRDTFYVSIVPVSNETYTKTTNIKKLIVSIKYFSDKDRLNYYNASDTLENLFNRDIKVKNKVLTISNTESNFINDEVDTMLDFLIYLTYFDDVKSESKKYEKMENIDVSYTV